MNLITFLALIETLLLFLAVWPFPFRLNRKLPDLPEDRRLQ